MVIVKERNSPNLFVYILVLLFGIFVIWNEYQRNKSNLEAILLSCGFLLILICLFFREVVFSLEKSLLIIRFKLLGIVYKSIRINADRVKFEGVLTFNLLFFAKQEEVLRITLDTDLEKQEKNFLMTEIYYKKRAYHVGNRKNAMQLFERIKDACRKEIGNID